MWVGHVVNLFQLLRPAMSALQCIYPFIEHLRERRMPIWPAVRDEMLLIEGLLFLCEHRLELVFWEKAYLSDSSTYGCPLRNLGLAVGAEGGRPAPREVAFHRPP